MINIREVNRSEVESLYAVARKAKAFWGYPEEMLDLWKEQLSVSELDLDRGVYYLAEDGKEIVGFCGASYSGNMAELEHMWVLPKMMRFGIGKALFGRIQHWCQSNHIEQLKVVADPNAGRFYEKMGGWYAGQEKAIPKPRMLPVYYFYIVGS